MRNFKKAISLAMAALMLSTIIAGCGEKKEPGSSSSEAPKASSATETKNTGTPENPVELVIYTWPLGQATTPSTEADLKMVQDFVVEKIGVRPKLIMAPVGSEAEKLNTLLASDEQLDMFVGDWSQYASKNVIIPLNDLISEYGKDLKAAWTQEAWNTATDRDGTIWCATKATPTTPYPLFVRTDWLKQAGLSMPTDFDSLENVLKVLKEKDFAGSGQTIPMITNLEQLNLCLSGGYTGLGYGRWLDPADSKVKPMVMNPDYKTFVERMADWYKKGYIFKESFAKPQTRDLIKANKVGISASWYSNITFGSAILQQNVPEAVYEIASIKGPKAEKSESPANASGGNGTMITKRCKNPEAAMKFINFGFEDVYNFITLKDGIEGTHWNFTDKELMINEIIDPEKITYRGELAYVPLGMAMEQKLNTNNPEQSIHYEYIRNKNLAFDRTTKQFDFGVIYDNAVITEEIPMLTDINTMIDESLIGFITGTKQMSQWDSFIKELDKAGVQTYIDVYTREYNAAK